MERLKDVIDEIHRRFHDGKCYKDKHKAKTTDEMWDHIKSSHKFVCRGLKRRAAEIGYDLDDVDFENLRETSLMHSESSSSVNGVASLDTSLEQPSTLPELDSRKKKFDLLGELKAIQRAPEPCCKVFQLLETEEEILLHMMAPTCHPIMTVKLYDLLNRSKANGEDLQLSYPRLFPLDWKRTGSHSPAPEGVYIVEKIVNHRIRDGKMEYLVRWEGFNATENSWEPVESFYDPGLRAIYAYLEEGLLNRSLIKESEHETTEVCDASTNTNSTRFEPPINRTRSGRSFNRAAESVEVEDSSQPDQILIRIHAVLYALHSHIINSGLRNIPKEMKEMMEEVTQLCRQKLGYGDIIHDQAEGDVEDRQRELQIDEGNEEGMPRCLKKRMKIVKKTPETPEIPESGSSVEDMPIHQDNSKVCISAELDDNLPKSDENVLDDQNDAFLERLYDDLCEAREKDERAEKLALMDSVNSGSQEEGEQNRMGEGNEAEREIGEEEDQEGEEGSVEVQCKAIEGQEQPDEEENQGEDEQEMQGNVVQDELKQGLMKEEQGYEDAAILYQIHSYEIEVIVKTEPEPINQVYEEEIVETQGEYQEEAKMFNNEFNETVNSVVFESTAANGPNLQGKGQEEPVDLSYRPMIVEPGNESEIEGNKRLRSGSTTFESRKRPKMKVDVEAIEEKLIPAKRARSESITEFVPQPSTSTETVERTLEDMKIEVETAEYNGQEETFEETHMINATFPMDYPQNYGQFQQAHPSQRSWIPSFGSPFPNCQSSVRCVETPFRGPIPPQMDPNLFQYQPPQPQYPPQVPPHPQWTQFFAYPTEYQPPPGYSVYYPYPGCPPGPFYGPRQPPYDRR